MKKPFEHWVNTYLPPEIADQAMKDKIASPLAPAEFHSLAGAIFFGVTRSDYWDRVFSKIIDGQFREPIKTKETC